MLAKCSGNWSISTSSMWHSELLPVLVPANPDNSEGCAMLASVCASKSMNSNECSCECPKRSLLDTSRPHLDTVLPPSASPLRSPFDSSLGPTRPACSSCTIKGARSVPPKCEFSVFCVEGALSVTRVPREPSDAVDNGREQIDAVDKGRDSADIGGAPYAASPLALGACAATPFGDGKRALTKEQY